MIISLFCVADGVSPSKEFLPISVTRMLLLNIISFLAGVLLMFLLMVDRKTFMGVCSLGDSIFVYKSGQHGLVIDTGAGDNLTGVDALLAYEKEVMHAENKELELHDANLSYSGVGGGCSGRSGGGRGVAVAAAQP